MSVQQPPNGETLGHVLRVLTSQYEATNALMLEIGDRVDFVREKMGGYHEQYMERFTSHDSRLKDNEKALARLLPLVETIGKTLAEIRPMIDEKLIHAGRVAETARSEVGTATARFQQALNMVRDDLDEKDDTLRSEMSARVSLLETAWAKRQADDAEILKARAEITKAHILSRKDVIIALIGLISGVIGGVITVATILAQRGG